MSTNRGRSGAERKLSRHVKLVLCGTDIVSHCRILNPTLTAVLLSIVLYSLYLYVSLGNILGITQFTSVRVTTPAGTEAAAPRNIDSSSPFSPASAYVSFRTQFYRNLHKSRKCVRGVLQN